MFKKLPETRGFRFFLNSRRVSALLLKILLLLVMPYAYLMLCGLVFDRLLRWYFMTDFIFFSLLFLYLIALALVVWAIARFARKR